MGIRMMGVGIIIRCASKSRFDAASLLVRLPFSFILKNSVSHRGHRDHRGKPKDC